MSRLQSIINPGGLKKAVIFSIEPPMGLFYDMMFILPFNGLALSLAIQFAIQMTTKTDDQHATARCRLATQQQVEQYTTRQAQQSGKQRKTEVCTHCIHLRSYISRSCSIPHVPIANVDAFLQWLHASTTNLINP